METGKTYKEDIKHAAVKGVADHPILAIKPPTMPVQGWPKPHPLALGWLGNPL